MRRTIPRGWVTVRASLRAEPFYLTTFLVGMSTPRVKMKVDERYIATSPYGLPSI